MVRAYKWSPKLPNLEVKVPTFQPKTNQSIDAAEVEARDGREPILQRRATSNSSIAARAAEARSVQARGDMSGHSSSDVHEVAESGVSGSGGALPHGAQIQASFGSHDITGVTAHTGSEATSATGALGAEAYATGAQIAFSSSSPSLHTAAHEAAHVVQQKGGVQLKGGVGQQGDSYEQHADAVADRVVAGQSAQGLLDSVAGSRSMVGATQAVQKQEATGLPKKEASGLAMSRLGHAKKAIDHTKNVFEFGAGNQIPALRATKMNSNFRLKVMRNMNYWDIADSVRELAMSNRAALTAAMADVAKGGNCGEHATVAFDYLRATASGLKIQVAAKSGLDHAFVIIGDLSGEKDNELVVSDPWPTQPTATLWEDHFAFTSDRAKIETHDSTVADGNNIKEVIASGLKLKPEGVAMINKSLSEEETEEAIDRDKKYYWNHREAAAQDKKYEYIEKEDEHGDEVDGP